MSAVITAEIKVAFVLSIAAAYTRVGDTTYPLACVCAHAARESAWGTSGLAGYNNLFGVKTGSSWTGRSVDIKTKEEYTPGTLTTVSATWRVYDSYDDCIRDYYALLSLKRYAAVKDATDDIDYFQRLRDAGYYTSTNYVDTMPAWLEQVHAILRGGGYEGETVTPQEIYHYDGLLGIMSDLCDYIVDEVIASRYGNGDDRRRRLGEFYDVVQTRVNRTLS